MEKQEQLLPNPRRTILQMAVAGILNDVGFAKSDKQCVESLTEVNVKSHFFELIDFGWEKIWNFFREKEQKLWMFCDCSTIDRELYSLAGCLLRFFYSMTQ